MKTIPPAVNADNTEVAQVSNVQVAQSVPKLISRWEVVNNKLVCQWFNNPD